MKKHLFGMSFVAVLCSLVVLFCVFGNTKADDSVEINTTNFPDSYFRAYVKKYDNDGNDVLTSDELNKLVSIYFNESAITNIKGYELLPNLKGVTLYHCNNITTLEIRSLLDDYHGVRLEYCENLTTLTVDAPNSQKLDCYILGCNNIASMNFTCDHFEQLLSISACKVDHLDLSHINSMRSLRVMSLSNLKTVDLSPVASSLEIIDLSFCRNLSSLDVSKCSKLKTLDVSDTALTELDIKDNHYLSYYDCSNTAIREACVYYAPRLNYALFNGERKEEGNTVTYKYNYGFTSNDCYEVIAPKNALVWGRTVYYTDSNAIKDPYLRNFLLKKYDYDKDLQFNDAEIFDVQDVIIYLQYDERQTITTLEGMSIFTNLQTFNTSGVNYDVADLGNLHCKFVCLSSSKIGTYIVPDNVDIERITFDTYYTDLESLYLGHQDKLKIFSCGVSTTGDYTFKLLDISDCPNLIEAYLTGTKEEQKGKYGNAETNYRYTTSDGKSLYVPHFVRVKYGKDILVTAQNGTVKGAGEHKVGDKVTLTAVPDSGYKFVGWYENDQLLSKDKSISFTSENDRSLEARFKADPNAPKATPTVKPNSDPTAGPTSKPSAKPTASVTGKPAVTSKPTSGTKPTSAPSKPSAAPTAIPADNDQAKQIMEFVKRIYIYVLDREPEEEGAAFWSGELWGFRRTGAEVAQGFIFSPEFESRGTSDTEFVTILYKTFFGRDPESDGLEFWLSQLSSGTMDRVTVANGFIYSQEWADTCASYGIRSGGDLKPAGKIAPTELTYSFVERLYTTAMGRDYDEEGRQYWASELANFNMTGEQAGAAFFLSEEMNGYGLSDEEFLSRLYATFMDREPDSDGSSYWLGVMSAGTPRADVVFGFTRSAEFTDKCVEARILPF